MTAMRRFSGDKPEKRNYTGKSTVGKPGRPGSDKSWKKPGENSDKPWKKSGEGSEKSWARKERSFDSNSKDSRGESDRPWKKNENSADKPYRKRENTTDRPWKKDERAGADRPWKKDENTSSDRRPSSDRPWKKDEKTSSDRPWKKDERPGSDRPWKKDTNSSTERRPSSDRPWKKDERTSSDRPWKKDEHSGSDRPWKKDEHSGSDRPWKKDANSSTERHPSSDRPWKKDDRTSSDRPWKKDANSSTERRPSSDRPWKKDERTSSDRPWKKDERSSDSSADKPWKKDTSRQGTYSDRPKDRKQSKPGFLSDEPIRLNKYIANAGICSRREADTMIEAGAVTVNGIVVTELGTKVSPDDKVQIGNDTLNPQKKVYLLLNKPKGYITTVDDPQERNTVMMLVKDVCKERIYPVGRLDRNTSGLLLMTNDGELAKKLTHPSHKVRKIYHVELDKALSKTDMIKMTEGIELEDGMMAVDEIAYTGTGDDKKNLGVVIHSGKNRIVRRMFESLDYEVTKLDRVAFANLTKKDLPRGRCRFLEESEINLLKMI